MKTVRTELSEREKELVGYLVKDCQSTGDIHDKLKRLFAGTIEQILEAEMEEHLGYSKNSIEGNNSGNSRNGYSKKKIISDYGACEIAVPRDRNGEFEPRIIEKRNTRTNEIEDMIAEIYGADVSQGMVSRITDRIMPEVHEWQNRPLDSVYPVVFFDGIVFNSRKDNKIIKKCIYSVLGINLEGRKDILGIWLSENESSSFYANICADLKSRGVSDIFIACHDNLTGLNEAICSVFPNTQNQLCIVHQVRNSCKFVPYKDRKAVCADLKKIYAAVNLDEAEYAKDRNWSELTTFFEYPPEIRKIIYTTNAVEGYHRMVRKFTKSKSILPTDDSIRKTLYFCVRNISKKWTMPVRDWGLAYAQFTLFFEDRIPV